MLPSPNIADLTPAEARFAIADAIDAHLSGAISIGHLAQWALKAYHARVTDDSDVTGDDDDDDAYVFDEETIPASEQLLVEALDALMFADEHTFALDTTTLTAMRNQLRIAVV